MAEMMAGESEIRTAMADLGMNRWADDLLDRLDEMELDRHLEISLAEADRGEDRPAEEVLESIIRDLRTGNILYENYAGRRH